MPYCLYFLSFMTIFIASFVTTKLINHKTNNSISFNGVDSFESHLVKHLESISSSLVNVAELHPKILFYWGNTVFFVVAFGFRIVFGLVENLLQHFGNLVGVFTRILQTLSFRSLLWNTLKRLTLYLAVTCTLPYT